MTNKTMILTCPVLSAIMMGLLVSMVICIFPYLGFDIDPRTISNGIMVWMFFIVPAIGVIAKILIGVKYIGYIPESKGWVYNLKKEIDGLDYSPALKDVSWEELKSVLPHKYTGTHEVYATLLLIDSLRGKIPSKGVPQEAKDFISKHYNVYIGLMLH